MVFISWCCSQASCYNRLTMGYTMYVIKLLHITGTDNKMMYLSFSSSNWIIIQNFTGSYFILIENKWAITAFCPTPLLPYPWNSIQWYPVSNIIWFQNNIKSRFHGWSFNKNIGQQVKVTQGQQIFLQIFKGFRLKMWPAVLKILMWWPYLTQNAHFQKELWDHLGKHSDQFSKCMGSGNKVHYFQFTLFR